MARDPDLPPPVNLTAEDWADLWPEPDPSLDSTEYAEPVGDDGPGTTDPEVI